MYAKVVLDGTIIDAVPVLTTCKYSDRSGMVLRCSGNDVPNGIISERTGEIYQVENWRRFPEFVETAGTVTIEWVEEDEYKELVESLDFDGPITPEDPGHEPDDPVTPDENDPDRLMTRAELTANVRILQESLDLLLSGVTE